MKKEGRTKNNSKIKIISVSLTFVLLMALAILFSACSSVTAPKSSEKPNLTSEMMNAIDFGKNQTPTVIHSTVSELRLVIESLNQPGNYVVNVTDSGNIDDFIILPKNCVISLRGNGQNTIGGNGSIINPLSGSHTLILRDITLSQPQDGNPIVMLFHGNLIMESGANLVCNSTPAVLVMNGGNFVMNDGEIHYSASAAHGVILSGSNASFEKKSGAAMYSDSDNNAVAVSNYSAIIAYGDIHGNETMSVKTNPEGTGIKSHTGTWKKL